MLRGEKSMKLLKIVKKSGKYKTKDGDYTKISNIDGDALMYLADLIINSDSNTKIAMDEPNQEKIIVNDAEKIIYENIYNELQEIIKEKENILAEINDIFEESYKEYSGDIDLNSNT